MKVLLVTNFASHYRAPLFERLGRAFEIEFIFFTRGTEEYWQPHLGVTESNIRARTITGLELVPKVRLNPRLGWTLLTDRYDLMIKCINGRLELPMAYVIARMRRKPFVLWASLWAHPTTFFHRFTHAVVRHIYRHSDAILCDGSHIRDFLVHGGIDEDKIFVAELAVDNDFFSAPVPEEDRHALRESVGAGDRPVILSVARLVDQKGLDVLIDAVGMLREHNPVVIVVGTGPLASQLTSQAQRLGVDLHLLGGREASEMPAVYAAADIFVISSVTTPLVKEVWGLAVNEAMCQGVPVVSTDAVGAAAGGLVTDEKTGLVVPERDARSLSEAIRRLLESKELRHRLGEAGRIRVRDTNYSVMVDAYAAAVAYATRSTNRSARS